MKVRRITAALAAVAFGGTLFVTGVWAGSERNDGARPQSVQGRGSFWGFDQRTGNPTGPEGPPDFWNYDPATGEKISDYSPGVAPEELAALWSVKQ